MAGHTTIRMYRYKPLSCRRPHQLASLLFDRGAAYPYTRYIGFVCIVRRVSPVALALDRRRSGAPRDSKAIGNL